MKKTILVAAIVLALCGSATAQTTFSLGLKAGGGMARQNISGVDWKLGFDGGAFFSVAFGQSFSIQPEILYTMKGLSVSSLDWKLNYIEIPILVKRQISMAGNVKPVFFVGPAIGILASAKSNISATGETGDIDIKDAFKSTDIGLCAGGGIELAVGTNGKLTMDIRGTFSITDNFEKTTPETELYKTGDTGLHNWNVAFMVGYGFDISPKAVSNP